MRFLASIFLFGILTVPAFSQNPKPKSGPTKPKPGATPQKRSAEKAEWDKAIAVTDPTERISALRKFVAGFPRSGKVGEAYLLIVAAEAGLGNDRLAAGDAKGGAEFYTAAAKDAPKPLPEQLFTETLSKFPTNLYFRKMRDAAYEVAKILEEKSEANAGQLLAIASFYLSVENGSEAKRVVEGAIRLEPNSSQAYQTLGLANRMDFQLEQSAAAYAKALELDPESITARRGLAEMNRSLGKADEAIVSYNEILTRDKANLPARTGLILALFDAGKRPEAEAEMARSLEANPGNVILLAGAAYWYAVHDEGEQAVAMSQKAIASDPRFIWSHIALARGLMVQKRPLDAERALLIARRYGNFPTLEYEIASARLAAGLYREAAEELSKSFSIRDGAIRSSLGGRVERESKYFTELVGFERRASIFAPTAADNPENAAQLRALLLLKQELDAPEPNAEAAANASDEFTKGDDAMKIHRQIFAASQLLDKKVALSKALEMAKAAPRSLDAGLSIPDPATAIMASEIYESRAIALARGEYLNVPVVARPVLSSILRGRVEEITGWAHYQMNDAGEAAVHLKRAEMVLPVNSSWWRSSTWRLGTALALAGKNTEALDAYVKSYKGSTPDVVRYNAIESLYKRVNGNTVGLEQRIGPNPAPAVAVETPVEKPSPEVVAEVKPTPSTGLPPGVPVATFTPAAPDVKSGLPPAGESAASPEPSPAELPASPTPSPAVESTPAAAEPAVPAPDLSPLASPSPRSETTPDIKPEPAAEATAAAAKPSAAGRDLFPPVIITIPSPDTVRTVAKKDDAAAGASPAPVEIKTVEEPKPTASPTAVEVPVGEGQQPSPTPDVVPVAEEAKPSASPSPTGSETTGAATATPSPAVIEAKQEPTATPTPAEITPAGSQTPAPSPTAAAEEKPAPSPTPEPPTETAVPEKTPDGTIAGDARPRLIETRPPAPSDIKPCTLTVSEESVTLRNGGGDLAVMVGRADGEDDLEGLAAISTSPQNVTVRRETIEGVTARALFVVRSISAKSGVYQVRFELPCGQREIVVRVR